jgi:hypothetical protein
MRKRAGAAVLVMVLVFIYGRPIDTHRFSWQRATALLLIYPGITNAGPREWAWRCAIIDHLCAAAEHLDAGGGDGNW